MTTHKTTVRQAKTEDDPYRRYTPTCTCGWTGRPTVNKRFAVEDAQLHARPRKEGRR